MSTNKKRLKQFITNYKSLDASTKLANNNVYLSNNYILHHYRQTLNLIKLILDNGGNITQNLNHCTIYVRYETYKQDHTLKKDHVVKYIDQNETLKEKVKIITLKELLNLLEITEPMLDVMPFTSFDFLFDDTAIIYDKKTKKTIYDLKHQDDDHFKIKNIKKENGSDKQTLQDLFPEYFENIN